MLMRYLRFGDPPPQPQWYKSRPTTDRILYQLAAQPHLMALLRPLLGEDIILWGGDIVERKRRAIHPWHVDIESAAPGARFASIWIGIEHTNRKTSLKMISRSHAFGVTVQQVQAENGYGRGQASDERILDWARERDPDCALIMPDMKDGEGLIFDGALWHSSHNRQRKGRRTAVLLQYASADTAVLKADLNNLEWPLRLIENPRPPVIVVSGKGNAAVNPVVAPPVAGPHKKPVSALAKPIRMPLDEDPTGKWRPFHQFGGCTFSAELMTCHISVLSAGQTPHPPHAHVEEEILIPLDGEAEITVARDADGKASNVRTLRPGSLVYYPPFRHHTISNGGIAPITYLMFKWRGAPLATEAPQEPQFYHFGGFGGQQHGKPFRPVPVFEHPTNYLTKLHCHVTDLQPGAGYPPHKDDYDVAILVLDGEVETLGRTIGPHGVVFYPANEPHGIRNPRARPARYLVFEFHRDPALAALAAPAAPDARAPGSGSWRRALATALSTMLRRIAP
jgi:mannose-6-phosphate isomerase-like protein (cupin superfamily)